MARLHGGGANRIDIADVAAIRAQRPMSAAAWLKRDATGEQDILFNKRGDSNRGWLFLVNASDELQFTFYGIADTVSTGTITDTNYHHVAVTVASGGTIVYYIDGASAGTASINAPLTTTQDLHIGPTLDNDGVVTGHTDFTSAEHAIWTRELGANEIRTVQFGVIRPPGSLELYLPLDGVGSPEPDLSGNGRNGTLVGSPATADHAPVGPRFGFDLGWQGAFTVAAVGGLSIPVAMHNYYRQRQWARA